MRYWYNASTQEPATAIAEKSRKATTRRVHRERGCKQTDGREQGAQASQPTGVITLCPKNRGMATGSAGRMATSRQDGEKPHKVPGSGSKPQSQ